MADSRGATKKNINKLDLGRDDGILALIASSILQKSNLPRHVVEQVRIADLHKSQMSAQLGGQPPSSLGVNQQFGDHFAEKERISSFEAGRARPTQMWGKVCVVFSCSINDSDDDADDDVDDVVDDICIYILDLNGDDSGEWSFKAPTIRFSSENFDVEAFWVLGNTLYIFQMHHWCKPESGRRVWTYKLPLSPETANRKLEENDLVEITPMKYPKFGPIATSTPDGKILVFSCIVEFGSEINAGKCDFELYDPDKQLWEQLPGLSYKDWAPERCGIHGCAFLNNESVVALQTDLGMFTLDLRPSESKQWNRFIPSCGDLSCALPLHGTHFILMGDNLCLSNLGAYELFGEKPWYFQYPQIPTLGHDHHPWRCDAIALLNMMVKNQGCFFCIMDVKLTDDTMIPHLVIRVYRFDYIKCKKDLEKGKMEGHLLPGLKVVKTCKFLLSPQRAADYFTTFCFCYIHPGSN